MEENALIVRVPKNEKIVTQIDEDLFDESREERKNLFFHCTEDGDNVRNRDYIFVIKR